MKRFFGIAVLALAVAAMPISLYAQGTTASKPTTPPPQKTTTTAAQKPAPPKAVTAAGTVTAVALDSVTVKGKTETWTFAVDTKTQVTAKGASHKTVALKKDGKTPVLTDFIKNGDAVSVTYHDENGSKHASAIRVTAPAPVK